jgi:hypothetical protein
LEERLPDRRKKRLKRASVEAILVSELEVLLVLLVPVIVYGLSGRGTVMTVVAAETIWYQLQHLHRWSMRWRRRDTVNLRYVMRLYKGIIICLLVRCETYSMTANVSEQKLRHFCFFALLTYQHVEVTVIV